MFHLRNATAADAKAIAEIHVAGWRHAYAELMPDEVLEQLDVEKRRSLWKEVTERHPDDVMVVEGPDGIVGFCQIAAARDADTDETVGEITGLYLDTSVMRRGLGRELCQYALSRLRSRGYSDVVLWVLRGNHVARTFYEKLGFSLDGTSKYIEKLQVHGVRYRIRVDM